MNEPPALAPILEAPLQPKFHLGTTLLAVGAGLVVDIGGTISSETTAMAKLGLIAGLAHLSTSIAEIAKGDHDPARLIAGYFLGMTFSFIGAYLAAVIGRNQPILNAVLCGLASTLTGLFFMGQSPLWYNVLGISTVVPLAAFAGYVARRTYR
ncbi:hypothetical protein BH09VER1_BH09VER1_13650 [soil metagenome]